MHARFYAPDLVEGSPAVDLPREEAEHLSRVLRLGVGDPVMVSGLRRGAVKDLELGLQEVVVTLKLRPDVILHPDARFSVENMGIMGEKFVAVDPGLGSRQTGS